MTERENFLDRIWKAYPCVEENRRSLSAWKDLVESQSLKPIHLSLGGKVRKVFPEDRVVVLYEGDLVLNLRFEEEPRWKSDSAVVSPLSILREGDVIGVEGRIGGGVGFDSESILLAEANILLFAPNRTRERGTRANKKIGEISPWPQRWASFVRGVRDFFLSQHFFEADTPYLVKCPGLEPSLDPFELAVENGCSRLKAFLPTSPEIGLKKLLAERAQSIFEIKKCFRNGERSPHHYPEFWMLEWYRIFVPLEALKRDLINLVSYLSDRNCIPSTFLRPHQSSMAQLFKEFLQFELKPDTSVQELQNLCVLHNLNSGSITNWNDFFHLLFLDKIEPHLGKYGALFIEEFPPRQSALARINEMGWADRFEFYWNGVEIANAFNELNDPNEQGARNQSDNKERIHLGKMPLPIDQSFMEAIESGMPPASGIALGLDRFFMVAWGLTEIDQFRPPDFGDEQAY